MSGKEFVYEQYKYVIEFDAEGENYFSERIFDAFLLYSMPFYWGGKNLHRYIPKNSFKYLDFKRKGADIISIINNTTFYEDNIKNIKEARNLLLNKLQIWPRVHKIIFNTC